MVLLVKVVGGKRRVCNGTCHRARKPACRCICSGRFHGVALELGREPVGLRDALGLEPISGEEAVRDLLAVVRKR